MRSPAQSIKREDYSFYIYWLFSLPGGKLKEQGFLSCHTTRFVNLTIIASLIILPPAVKFPIKILVIPFLNR